MADRDRIDAFFARPGRWHDALNALRAVLAECPVVEELKWRQPCYTHDGGNVAIIGRYRDFCALSFFKGVLLSDPEGILVAPGENSRAARLVKITDASQVTDRAAVLKAYVEEAVELEKAGRKVDLPKDDFDLPEELRRRLEEFPDLRTAFQALTPGRQRGYALHFSQPKQAKTRIARIDRAAEAILKGKGPHDR